MMLGLGGLEILLLKVLPSIGLIIVIGESICLDQMFLTDVLKRLLRSAGRASLPTCSQIPSRLLSRRRERQLRHTRPSLEALKGEAQQPTRRSSQFTTILPKARQLQTSRRYHRLRGRLRTHQRPFPPSADQLLGRRQSGLVACPFGGSYSLPCLCRGLCPF